MKITIESTDLITEMQGISCRVWRGVTERGTKVELLAPLIRVARNADASQLEQELKELPAPEVMRRVGIFDPWSEPIDLRKVI